VFKIGDFAIIAQVPTSQLRYYDEIGLFKPSHTDPFNGYRYYQIEQLADLNRIIALKNLGMSLDEVRQLLASHVSNHDIRSLLEAKKDEIEQRLAEEQSLLRQVEARLQLLEQGYAPVTQPVIVKPVSAQHYLGLERISPDQETFIAEFTCLYNLMHQVELPERSYCACIAQNAGYEPDGFQWELGFYVSEAPQNELQIAESICLRPWQLPAVDHMASIIHVGPLQSGGLAYAALSQWIAFHHYDICGPFREIFLVSDAPLDIAASMVMEVQVPISI
jgi:DNA-binding transcriptional MerR regulator